EELRRSIERDQAAVSRLLLDNNIESVDAKLTEAGEELDLAVKDRAGVQETISFIETQTEEYLLALNNPAGRQIPDDIRQRVRQNPLIQQLESQLQNVNARKRSEERLGFGPGHPAIKALQAQIDGLQEEIATRTAELQEESFDAAISNLRVQLNQARSLESELTDRIKEAQDRLTEIARIGQEVQALKRRVQQTQDRVSRTEEELDEVEGVLSVAEQGRVTVFQPPRLPERLSFPKRVIVVPAGFLAVVGLTAGIILLRELLDQRVKGPADIAMIPRTPVLGMLPVVSEDPSRPERAESAFHDRPAGVFAEAVRQLRVALATKVQQAGHRSVLIVPASPRSGATTLVTNLAEAVSRADAKVLILDANLRRPGIHRLFNLDAAPGLADVLAKTTEVDDALCKTDNPNLDVMTVGSPEHRVFERLSTESMSELLARLEARYDLVLLDVAPAQVAGDAAGLANRVGGVVLVTRALAEKRGLIARLKNELAGTHAEFLGVVVNAVRSSAGGYFKRNMREAHAYQNKAKAAAEA
ncbi:MAG: polysaccharide biosynthesis tyrosine autokinase, partial [Planctomycetota bacterium]